MEVAEVEVEEELDLLPLELPQTKITEKMEGAVIITHAELEVEVEVDVKRVAHQLVDTVVELEVADIIAILADNECGMVREELEEEGVVRFREFVEVDIEVADFVVREEMLRPTEAVEVEVEQREVPQRLI